MTLEELNAQLDFKENGKNKPRAGGPKSPTSNMTSYHQSEDNGQYDDPMLDDTVLPLFTDPDIEDTLEEDEAITFD